MKKQLKSINEYFSGKIDDHLLVIYSEGSGKFGDSVVFLIILGLEHLSEIKNIMESAPTEEALNYINENMIDYSFTASFDLEEGYVSNFFKDFYNIKKFILMPEVKKHPFKVK